ncbi:MAG: aminopeptidase [Leptothrix sp. (in: b-proteobacteria)]
MSGGWRSLARAALIGAGALLAGCAQQRSDVGYYWQSVSGHMAMLQAAQPVAELIDDTATPADLRVRLALSQRIRNFAVRELHLPDNASYRRYADLGRPAVVWNVVAAPELSLALKTWCFPVMGCVGYRGYFDRAAADALATELRAQGLEVSVYGVPAYSTLGKLPGTFFADPLLNTFIRYPEGELARMVFHELAHQEAYAPDDTMFNESFATAVERIGSAMWLAREADAAARDEYARLDARRQDFRALTSRYRALFDASYRSSAAEADKRQRKTELLAALRAEAATLKAERWAGYTGYDDWFGRVNNASLAVLAAYNAQVGDFERLFERQGRDFERFYAEVRRLAALPKAERDRLLSL